MRKDHACGFRTGEGKTSLGKIVSSVCRTICWTIMFSVIVWLTIGMNDTAYGSDFDNPNLVIDVGGHVVKKAHPRIWLTDERIQRLRDDAASQTDKFSRLIFVAENQKESSVRFQVVLNYLLAYVATQDSIYADRAIAKVDKYITAKYGNRYKAAQNMMSLALVYDWLYDYEGLTDEKKSKYLSWLTEEDPDGSTAFYKRSQYDNAYVYGSFTTSYQQSWHNYHFLGMLNLFVTGAATIEDPEDPQADWVAESIDHWYANTREGLDFNGKGGGSPEDDTYWQESICFLSRFLLAVETACGENLTSELPYLKDRLKYSLLTSFPKPTDWNGEPAWEYILQGDANWNINSINHYHRMAQWMLIELLPDETDTLYLQSWLTETPVTQTYNYKFAGEEFLWAQNDRDSLPYSDVTPSHFAEGTGRVLMRQDWDEDATHIGFQCGDHFEYHQHYAQGHFSLFKESPLLVDSGKYADTYLSHARNYYYRTIAHNSLLVYDEREGSGSEEGGAFYKMRGSKNGVNDGGQIVSTLCDETGERIEQGDESVFTVTDWFEHEAIYDSGEIPAFEDTGHYVFVNGDASKAYHDWKVSHFDRSLLYVRDMDALVVFDRVSVPQFENKKRMLFHFQGEPVVDGGTEEKIHGKDNPNGGVWRYELAQSVRVNHDGATLTYIPVLPENPEIVKIGGPDTDGSYDTAGSFEYWVPYNGNNLEEGGKNYTTNSEKTGRGQWRIEVAPSFLQESDIFCHVLIPRSEGNGMAEPDVESVTVATGDMNGTSLVADSTLVALFSNDPDGVAADHVEYTLSGGTSGDQRHIIIGCEPGTYDIYIDGEPVYSEQLTTDAGNLMFTTSGGTTFAINRSGELVEDTTPPSSPEILMGQALSTSAISLSWSDSTDNTGVSGYNIFRNNDFIAEASKTEYIDTGLEPETTYTYSVSAFDEAGNESDQSIPVTVTTKAEEELPIAVISTDTTTGNSPLSVQFDGSNSSDPNGGELTYAWDFGDGGTSELMSPSHTFTAETGVTSTYTVTLTVSNGSSYGTALVDIQVIGPDEEDENDDGDNQAPIVVKPSWQSINENEVRSFDIDATDPDGDELTIVLVDPESTPWVSISGKTVTLSPTYKDATSGSIRVYFSVSDGTDVVDTYFSIKVVNVDQIPVFGPVEPVSLSNGETLEIELSAEDPDGVAITFTASLWGHFYDWVSLEGSVITLTPTTVSPGTHKFTVYAKGDGWQKASQMVEIEILDEASNDDDGTDTDDQNSPPEVVKPAWQSIDENEIRTFDIEATDPDGDELIISIDDPDETPWITVDGTTVTLAPTYSDATRGSARINFSVSDGTNVVDKYFEVKVVNVDQIPVFDPIEAVSLPNGETLEIQLSAEDPDGVAITFTVGLWGHLYDWVFLDESKITLKPETVKAGSHEIKVYAKGDGWKKVMQILKVTITE